MSSLARRKGRTCLADVPRADVGLLLLLLLLLLRLRRLSAASARLAEHQVIELDREQAVELPAILARLNRELAYTHSRKAAVERGRGSDGFGPLGAKVSLSLALATFSQAMRKRQEVLHSPEAYHGWLQDLIGRLEAHLDELQPPANSVAEPGPRGDAEPIAAPVPMGLSQDRLLEAAGFTVVHEAGGAKQADLSAPARLTQEEELQLRRDSRQAWRSCVDELQGKLATRSGAARLWQQRQDCATRVARSGCDSSPLSAELAAEELQAWGDLPPAEEGVARARRWRPSQAQQELMQALSLRLGGERPEDVVLEG
ncbi:unnamed protein product [Effrenium voratum]|nr:unnamed protein product [Effrenium voratum]